MADELGTVAREKSVSQEFSRLRVDENDLYRLGVMVKALSDAHGGAADMEIVSADGEDTYRATSPEVFVAPDAPTAIRSVSMSYRHFRAPVSCSVSLSAGDHSRASLAVSGSDAPVVSGTFRELQRELLARSTGDRAFTGLLYSRAMTGLLVWSMLALVLAASTYSIFDLSLRFVGFVVPGFWGSGIHGALQVVGVGAVILGFALGPWLAIDFLRGCFPRVQFAGRLSDTSTARRQALMAVGSLVILPLVLNVAAGLWTNYLSRSLSQIRQPAPWPQCSRGWRVTGDSVRWESFRPGSAQTHSAARKGASGAGGRVEGTAGKRSP